MKDFRLPPSPVITGVPQRTTVQKPNAVSGQGDKTFRQVLGQAVAETQVQKQLSLSKHAQTRALQRSIDISENDMLRMEKAVDMAQDKGITDTLVFMNNTAFIVNVPNRVVVTIVDGNEQQENVFTNINGAVII